MTKQKFQNQIATIVSNLIANNDYFTMTFNSYGKEVEINFYEDTKEGCETIAKRFFMNNIETEIKQTNHNRFCLTVKLKGRY